MSSPPESTSPQNPTGAWSRIRLLGWVSLIGLLLIGVTFLWRWYSVSPQPTPEPPFPPGISDAEVHVVVEAAYKRLLSNRSSGAEWGEYGTILLANLFDQDADLCFQKASTLSPADPRWPYARGQIAQKRRPESALDLLHAASQKAESDPDFRQAFSLTYAEALLERGQTEQAETILSQQLSPPNPERAQYGLGLIAMGRNQYVEATRWFEEASKHPSCRKQATGQLAILARARGDATVAKQLEAEVALMDPDPPWPDPYLDRVVTLQVGQRGINRRIALLERDGNFAEAIELYREQIDRNRTSQALTGIGVNLARLSRHDEAIPYLREAVKLDPIDSTARYTLALVLFSKWEILVSQNPTIPGADEGFREVVEEARKTTELKPNHARAYLFWGLALKYLNRPAEAIAPLRRGLTIEPELFDLHLALGQVLAAAGDKSGAESSFKAAKSIRSKDPRPDQELARLRSP